MNSQHSHMPQRGRGGVRWGGEERQALGLAAMTSMTSTGEAEARPAGGAAQWIRGETSVVQPVPLVLPIYV